MSPTNVNWLYLPNLFCSTSLHENPQLYSSICFSLFLFPLPSGIPVTHARPFPVSFSIQITSHIILYLLSWYNWTPFGPVPFSHSKVSPVCGHSLLRHSLIHFSIFPHPLSLWLFYYFQSYIFTFIFCWSDLAVRSTTEFLNERFIFLVLEFLFGSFYRFLFSVQILNFVLHEQLNILHRRFLRSVLITVNVSDVFWFWSFVFAPMSA